MWLAKVYVTLKPVVNDPQGLTIQGALKDLGFEGVERVRSGKYFEIALRTDNKDQADKAIKDMCSKLLANPVIEDYRFELDPLS